MTSTPSSSTSTNKRKRKRQPQPDTVTLECTRKRIRASKTFDDTMIRNLIRARTILDVPYPALVTYFDTDRKGLRTRLNEAKDKPGFNEDALKATEEEDQWNSARDAIKELHLAHEKAKKAKVHPGRMPGYSEEDKITLLANDFRQYNKKTIEELGASLDPKRTADGVRKILSKIRPSARLKGKARKEAKRLDEEEDHAEEDVEYPIRPWEEGDYELLVDLMNNGTTRHAASVLRQQLAKCTSTYSAIMKWNDIQQENSDDRVCRGCFVRKSKDHFHNPNGENYVRCDSCRAYHKEVQSSLEGKLYAKAYGCWDTERTKFKDHGNLVYDDDMLQTIKKILNKSYHTCVEDFHGECKYCGRKLVFEGALVHQNRCVASLDHLDPTLPAVHPLQTMQMICTACNCAKSDMEESEFLSFISHVKQAPVDHQFIPLPAQGLYQRVAALQGDHVRADAIKSEKGQTVGQTTTAEEFLDVARQNGAVCAFSNIKGSFDKNTTPAWKRLSFDRKTNRDEEGRQHLHYKENLQVVLYTCNNARGAAPVSELVSWLQALKQSPVVTTNP